VDFHFTSDSNLKEYYVLCSFRDSNMKGVFTGIEKFVGADSCKFEKYFKVE